MAARDSQRIVLHRDRAEVEFARVVAFSDGVFAIAITLLVLALEIPPDADVSEQLGDRGAEFFAYFLSFAVIGRFWMAHHRIFGSIARFDTTLVVINLAYLAFIALIPFTSEVLGNYSDDSWGLALYAANLTAVSLSSWMMIRYSDNRGLIREDPESGARFAGAASFIVAGVFALSIPLAFVSPTLATISWASLFVMGDRVVDKLTGIERPR